MLAGKPTPFCFSTNQLVESKTWATNAHLTQIGSRNVKGEVMSTHGGVVGNTKPIGGGTGGDGLHGIERQHYQF